MFQRLARLNWRYAVAETSLIFVGITAAIVFDEWREDRARAALERELLTQIRADLIATRLDLEGDIARAERQLDAGQRLITALEESRVYDEAVQDLMLMSFLGNLRAKTSGYSALLSYGLDVIGDAEIRAAITGFHELTLSVIGDIERIIAGRAEPYSDVLAPHLRAAESIPWPDASTGGVGFLPGGPLRIRNWEDLRTERELGFRLLQIHGPRAGVQVMYLEARAEIDVLIERIDEVLRASP